MFHGKKIVINDDNNKVPLKFEDQRKVALIASTQKSWVTDLYRQ